MADDPIRRQKALAVFPLWERYEQSVASYLVVPDLAAAIREALFTFNDLVYISDRGIQKLLRETDRRDLTRALKRTQDEVKEKLLSNLSRRASQMLIEEVEALGPTRMSEVKEAQANIARLALSLHDSGELTIVRPGSDDPLV